MTNRQIDEQIDRATYYLFVCCTLTIPSVLEDDGVVCALILHEPVLDVAWGKWCRREARCPSTGSASSPSHPASGGVSASGRTWGEGGGRVDKEEGGGIRGRDGGATKTSEGEKQNN